MAEKVKTQSSPILQENTYEVIEVKELNFFDLSGDKANTKGTSNKFYHAELHKSKSGNQYQIYTMYGPTGRVQAREWRGFSDLIGAQKEFKRIIASKVKKGYEVIDVAQRALGSDDAKKIVKPVKFNNVEEDVATKPASKLNDGQKVLVEILFGSQEQFVAQTLKCPLGQLTNEHIDRGREALNEAKAIINISSNISAGNKNKLLDLTNKFYALIPHNLGAGARGQMTHLLLDSLDKVVAKEQDLDTLLDAKQVNAVLVANSGIDGKYDSLNCDFDLMDPNSKEFKFISQYFSQSKVRGHGFDRESVYRIWSMKRKDSKEAAFYNNLERLAKECKTGNVFGQEASLGRSFDISTRSDLNKDQLDLYNKANVWLCWHGTRSANLVGITRRGLLIRPTGAVYTGSMFGDGKYFAWQSTKSLNYCDGGYWTGGKASSRYMFLLDVAFGNMHKVTQSQFFKNPPKGFHSVYGKSGHSLRNDEMITYDFEDKDNQSAIRYLLEIR